MVVVVVVKSGDQLGILPARSRRAPPRSPPATLLRTFGPIRHLLRCRRGSRRLRCCCCCRRPPPKTRRLKPDNSVSVAGDGGEKKTACLPKHTHTHTRTRGGGGGGGGGGLARVTERKTHPQPTNSSGGFAGWKLGQPISDDFTWVSVFSPPVAEVHRRSH